MRISSLLGSKTVDSYHNPHPYDRYVADPKSVSSGNTVRLLHDGVEVFPEIRSLFAKATTYIHIEMYFWNSDPFGWEMADLLAAAAQRGVLVRLLVDAAGCIDTQIDIFDSLEKQGVHVEMFHPLAPWRPRWSWNNRSHRKIIIADGNIAIVGGLNISGEYAATKDSISLWRDCAFRIEGPAVRIINQAFSHSWAGHPDREPVGQQFLELVQPGLPNSMVRDGMNGTFQSADPISSEFGEEHGGGQEQGSLDGVVGEESASHREVSASLFASDPTSGCQVPAGQHHFHKLPDVTRHSIDVAVIPTGTPWPRNAIERAVVYAIKHARTSVYIACAYFIPGAQLRRALRKASRRGVDVRLLLPSESTDIKTVYYASRHLYGRLLRANIRIFEWSGEMLHAKMVIVDSTYVLVGSANLDPRSRYHNHELSVAALSASIGLHAHERFLTDTRHSKEIKKESWLKRGVGKRLLERIAFLFRYWL